MLTPGGHRRFSTADLLDLGTSRRKVSGMRDLGDEFGQLALEHTREEIVVRRDAQWMQAFDEEKRAEKRRSGKRLLGLMLRYVASEGNGEDLLEQALQIGREYGSDARSSGIPLRSALEASMFFRDTILESTLELPRSVHMDPGTNVELVGRINHLLNSIQLAIVEAYEPHTKAGHAG